MKDPFSRLRQQAEQRADMADIDIAALSEAEIKQIIQDLAVHRIELEMQNDELQRANKDLEDAKRSYVELFDFAPVGYLTLDQEYRTTRVNLTFARLIGLPRERLMNMAFTECICPDFQDVFHFAIRKLTAAYETQQLDLQLRRGDRTLFWAHVEMASRDRGQTYLLSISDITRQKGAEQALQASEAKFRELFDVVVDPMFIHDLTGNFLEVNESACRALGYSRQQLIQRNLVDIVVGFSAHEIPEVIAELTRTKEILFESTHKTITGQLFPVEVHAKIIQFEGKPAILSLARDISRRKEAEQRYELLSNVTFEGILVHKSGLALDVNASCLRLTGYGREEVLGKNLLEFIASAEDREMARRKMIMQEVAPYVVKVKRKDGSVFDAEIEARNVEYHGESVRIVAMRDITARLRAEEALKASEATNQRLADATFEAIFFSEHGICIHQNNTAERMFGYTLHEAIGKPAKEWIYPDYRELVKQKMKAHVVGPYEAVALRKDGSTFPCEIQAKTAIHGDRQVRITALRDITERKQAEEALKESETKYRSIVEHSIDGIVLTDETGNIVEWNKAQEELSEIPKSAALTQKIWDLHFQLTPPELQTEAAYRAIRKRFDELYASGGAGVLGKHYEVLIWAHGVQKTIVQSSFVIHTQQGYRLASIARDITDRKHAEEALQANEERFRAIFEQAAAGIVTVAPNGRIIAVNQRLCDILGYAQEELLQLTPEELTWPGDMAPDMEYIQEVIAGKRNAYQLEKRYRHQDGHPVWANLSSNVVRDEQGNIRYVIGVIIDISDRKQAEAALKEALTEKDILLQEIHHRVKNNMQTIASLLYKQQQHTDDERARAILDDSIQRIKSMALIHEQIYRSRSLARINLAEYISHFATKLVKTYRPEGSSVTLRLKLEEIYLPVDTSLPVALILNELIVNALKYAFPDASSGEIVIECHEKAREITLIVRDNGVGLPEHFDLEQTTTLGLYLVYNLAARQLGGAIEIHRKHPTTFAIKFRRVDN